MKKLCKVCNKRKAGYFTRTSGKSYTDKQHDLCMKCYRAELNRLHQKLLQNISNSLSDI